MVGEALGGRGGRKGRRDGRERGERNEENAMLICVIPLCIAQQLVNTIRIGGYQSWWGRA